MLKLNGALTMNKYCKRYCIKTKQMETMNFSFFTIKANLLMK